MSKSYEVGQTVYFATASSYGCCRQVLLGDGPEFSYSAVVHMWPMIVERVTPKGAYIVGPPYSIRPSWIPKWVHDDRAHRIKTKRAALLELRARKRTRVRNCDRRLASAKAQLAAVERELS